MSMRLMLSLLCFSLIAVVSGQAFATDCYLGNKGGRVQITFPVPDIDVPNGAQVGQKIWESKDIRALVYCDNNRSPGYASENVQAWINPQAGSVGNAWQMGISWDGKDYDLSGSPVSVDTGYCLDDSRLAGYNAAQIRQRNLQSRLCSGNADDVHPSRRFPARFRLYLKLRHLGGQRAEQRIQSHSVLQFGGRTAMSGTAYNLQYIVTSLGNISVPDCRVVLTMEPENQVIDFGSFTVAEIMRQNLTRTFSVKASVPDNTDCSSSYKLQTTFYTEQSLSSGGSALLAGNGLQLRILADNTPGIFNKYSPFAEFSSGMKESSRVYSAELSRVPGSDIVPGPFNEVVLFMVSYY